MNEKVIDIKADQWSLEIKGSRKMWYTREIGREREVGVGWGAWFELQGIPMPEYKWERRLHVGTGHRHFGAAETRLRNTPK